MSNRIDAVLCLPLCLRQVTLHISNCPKPDQIVQFCEVRRQIPTFNDPALGPTLS